MNEYILNQIKEIIAECDEIQDSNESGYTKSMAIQTAYEHIKDLMKGGD